MPLDPVETVKSGYDSMADRYEAWSRAGSDPRDWFLDELSSNLADRARVLEIGCGAGLTLERLARRFDVTGLDLSPEQVRRARVRVPSAHIIERDVRTVDLPRETYDAVVALYLMGHVPRDEHAAVYWRIAAALRPGGAFLASIAVLDEPGATGEWLGVPMFFSSWPAETNSRLVREAGLELEVDRLEETQEPEGPVTFQWVIARATPQQDRFG